MVLPTKRDCRYQAAIVEDGRVQHEHHIIEGLAWFPVEQPELWGPEIDEDPITSANLERVRAALRT